MELFFMLVLIRIIDPIGIIINLVISLISRKKWIIFFSGFSAYLITEIILFSNNQHRYFGQNITPLLIGSIIQAYIIYLLGSSKNLSFLKKEKNDSTDKD